MKVLLLAGKDITTNIVYHAINARYPFEQVILENPVSRVELLKKRCKRQGHLKTIGQVAFQLGIVSWLRIVSKKRIKDILQEHNLNVSDDYRKLPECVEVESVNSAECKELLQRIQPDLVIVNGTRIISRDILTCTNAVFINMHVGITPKYRGVHGGYWAVYNRDLEHCGVTVHLIDAGIDTGGILYQATIAPGEKDNFCTYPYLQVAAGIELERKAIEDFTLGKIKTITVNLPSKLYYHPTLMQYIRGYICYGVK